MPKVGSGNGVANIRIHRQSLEGVNSLNQIPNVKSIYIQHDNGFYKYQVKKIVIDPVDSDAFYLTIKQEHNTIPTGSASSALVFAPYIAGKFKNSDFDSLLGNATEGQTSLLYQVVDNNGSQLQPTNLSAINNRTAGFAQVQDSNYVIGSYTRPRYDGTKHTADDFNLQSSTGFTPVEQNSAYFGYFKTIARTSPELYKKTELSLDYLFDLAGNRITLDNSETATAIVQQNFSQGSFVKLALDDPKATGENMTEINGLKRVHKPGKYVEYITGTEVTLGVFTGSISFTTDDNVTDYTFLAVGSSNQPLTVPTQLQFNTVEYNPQSYYSAASDSYTFGQDSAAQIAFRVQGTLRNERTQTHDFTVSIKLDSTTIATKTVNVAANSELDFDLASNYRYFYNTEEITVEASSTAGAQGSVLAGVEFDLVQDPLAEISLPKVSLWSTGSASGNSITGSSGLASIYGNRIQAPNQGTNFPSASLPFTVEIGDEFRFDGNEINTYTVSNVVKAGKVFVEFDRNIPPQININNFTHRRYVDSSKHILLNMDKPLGATTGGIIVPQYMDASAEESIGKVISNLRERGII